MKKFGDDWTLMVAALLLEGTQRRGQNGVSNTTIVVGQSLALTGPDQNPSWRNPFNWRCESCKKLMGHG